VQATGTASEGCPIIAARSKARMNPLTGNEVALILPRVEHGQEKESHGGRRFWKAPLLAQARLCALLCRMAADLTKVRLDEKFAIFSEHWRPKIVGELNGQEVKLVKFKGEFVWHAHEKEDELFLVWRGRIRIDFRDRNTVELEPGEFLIVPRGVEHRPSAIEECEVLLFEPAATRNTGNISDETLTAPGGVRV
jgi:mannose-6-phosphate isomerase-like protein (cupin superfamily)